MSEELEQEGYEPEGTMYLYCSQCRCETRTTTWVKEKPLSIVRECHECGEFNV